MSTQQKNKLASMAKKKNGPGGEKKKYSMPQIKKKPDLVIKKEWNKPGKKRTVTRTEFAKGTGKPSTRTVTRTSPPKKETRNIVLKSPQPKGAVGMKGVSKPNIPVKKVKTPTKPPRKPVGGKKLKPTKMKRRKRPNKMIRTRAKKTKIC